jgi:YebC/PmpR family DNA-binding regulatory protein
MSGHSKWSTIKRAKGATDVKRGKVFTKLTREVAVAARTGGSDPSMNASLRLAIDRARRENMPLDTIDRTIKRATGQTGEDQANFEDIVYEGFGPSGIAILVTALTDNRNRTASEIRHAFERNNGKLGQIGTVGYLFDQKGIITIKISNEKAEEVALDAIDKGAEDFLILDEHLELIVSVDMLEEIRSWCDSIQLEIVIAELAMIPKVQVNVDDHPAQQALKLLDRLEDLDDVQRVFSNADFSQSVLELYESGV